MGERAATPAGAEVGLPRHGSRPPLAVAARPGGGIALSRRGPSGSEVFAGARRILAGPGLGELVSSRGDGEEETVASVPDALKSSRTRPASLPA